MKIARRAAGILLVCQAVLTGVGAAEAFSHLDLLALKRLQDVEVSPDGKFAACAVREPRMEENKFVSHIWIVPTEGGAPRQITNHEKGESRPKWSPDGKTIAFLSSRGGSQQVWLLPVDGGEARQLTAISTEADNHIWSPDGKLIAFTSDVWPDLPDDAAQKKRADELETSAVKAQVIDHLLYRHWADWRRGKRTHIFVTEVSASPGEDGARGARDLTPGDFDSPVFSLGAPHLFGISPDGKTLAFTRGPERKIEAWSTDAALCLVPTSGGEVKNVTEQNKGWDGSPRYSPNGKFIAYRSQEREGYESDRMRLALLEVASGHTEYLATELDRSVEEILWSPDGRTIYFTVEDESEMALHSIEPAAGAKAKRLFRGTHFGDLSMPASGAFAIGSMDSMLRPAEVARISLGQPVQMKRLTEVNEKALSGKALPTAESIRYAGARGAMIQAWLLKPPGFDASRRYPCLILIHGGPQGAWNNAFSFRWNLMTYAARGYVVLAPNPHGSTGFGQAFTEQISGDWGGAVFEDIMKGADWAAAQKYVDGERLGAAGASFGGYMVNWILGHTDRFKALVSHAGVYNLESEYGVTEELWFPEWEFKGPPWENRELYEKFSPHRFAANFKTPTLVTHGELDYRVPIDQGLQLFTALQRRGVDSRLLYYPDEGHWILKLKNSRLFYETVLAWLDRHLRPD